MRLHLVPFFGTYDLSDLEQHAELFDRYVAAKLEGWPLCEDGRKHPHRYAARLEAGCAPAADPGEPGR